MPSVILLDDDISLVITNVNSPNDVTRQLVNHYGLPPDTVILRWTRDERTLGWRALVEYPFDWCVNRVSGTRGDLVGADYDYNEEV